MLHTLNLIVINLSRAFSSVIEHSIKKGIYTNTQRMWIMLYYCQYILILIYVMD